MLRLDPLGDLRRTHFCGEVRPSDVGREIVLCGWVRKRRDHGGVIFVDLRDRTGIAQVVFKPDSAPAAHERAQAVRSEFVLAVRGRLARRDPEVVNPNLPTGEVELVAEEVRILNGATTPPFAIEDDVQIDEAVRLEYRIHDLRRPMMQRRLAQRHALAQSMRASCNARGLLEIETPILARATPEGARDFLVPSRVHHGSFYALPQSPQIMKQMLMVAGTEFKVFAGALGAGGVVRALPVPGADALSRSELDKLNELARSFGAKGLAWARVNPDGSWQSPIAKFLSDAERDAIAKRAGLRPGHVILFGADREKVVCEVLGRIRLELGARLDRWDGRVWDPHFVVGFPLFEETDDGKLTYMHMPFVAPLESELPKLDSDPKSVIATHYDLVLNGVELGSGSLRNHRSDVQLKILSIMGYSEAEARARFGFMLDALDAGAPPHGGFAFGFDRFALMLSGGDSLRDVLAFPKTQRAQDLFMKSPTPVDPAQLVELGLRLRGD